MKFLQHLGKLLPRRLLANPIRVVINELKEQIKLLKEVLKKNGYPTGELGTQIKEVSLLINRKKEKRGIDGKFDSNYFFAMVNLL